jgi:hypothetical protein
MLDSCTTTILFLGCLVKWAVNNPSPHIMLPHISSQVICIFLQLFVTINHFIIVTASSVHAKVVGILVHCQHVKSTCAVDTHLFIVARCIFVFPIADSQPFAHPALAKVRFVMQTYCGSAA